MKITKHVSFILSVIMLLCALTSCSVFDIAIKYNARLYSDATQWVNEDFLKENMVYGAYYRNESGQLCQDDSSPKSRAFVIEDDEQYDTFFKQNSFDVNFEKEVVVLYIFSDTNNRNYILKGLELNDKELTVQVQLQKSLVDDTIMPYQRCLVLKMNKVEIEAVKFEELKRNGYEEL